MRPFFAFVLELGSRSASGLHLMGRAFLFKVHWQRDTDFRLACPFFVEAMNDVRTDYSYRPAMVRFLGQLLMFAIELDAKHTVYWIRYGETLTEDDFARLDAVGAVLGATTGHLNSIHDFTDVEAFEISPAFIERQGAVSQRSVGKRRVFVRGAIGLQPLLHAYALQQLRSGLPAPRIVASRMEAFHLLATSARRFRPIEMDWLKANQQRHAD
jgi:hypothetical protein